MRAKPADQVADSGGQGADDEHLESAANEGKPRDAALQHPESEQCAAGGDQREHQRDVHAEEKVGPSGMRAAHA